VYELTADERGRAIADITRTLEANTLKHNVAKTYPLAEIVAAHECVEQGSAIGNVVMEIA
jgi:NADPH2:quinone reductase